MAPRAPLVGEGSDLGRRLAIEIDPDTRWWLRTLAEDGTEVDARELGEHVARVVAMRLSEVAGRLGVKASTLPRAWDDHSMPRPRGVLIQPYHGRVAVSLFRDGGEVATVQLEPEVAADLAQAIAISLGL